MSIIKKTILYFSITTVLALPLFFIIPTSRTSAEKCTITGVVAGLPEPLTHHTTLRISSSYCVNYGAQLVIEEIDFLYNNVVSGDESENLFSVPLDPSGETNIVLLPGEYKCDNEGTPDCEIKITITPYTYTNGNKVTSTPYVLSSKITYDCKVAGACDQSLIWKWGYPEVVATTCKVVSAVFENPKDVGFVGDTDGKTLYVGKQNAILVTTEHCGGKKIYLNLVEETNASGNLKSVANSTDTEPGLDNIELVVPTSESIRLDLITGEQRCNQNSDGPDCTYHIVAGTSQFTATDALGNLYYSKGKPGGRLAYECDGVCIDFWQVMNDSNHSSINPVALENAGTSVVSPECIGPDGKPIDGCYSIPDEVASIFSRFGNINNLGDFINAIIALAIGIAGVLTVVMIMWDGFTYWNAGKQGKESELTAVKGRIWKRVLGLLLLLSIYTLLRTINPDLLNLTPRIDALTLEKIEQSAPKTADGTPILTGGGDKAASNDVLAVNKNIDTYDALFKKYASQYGRDCNLLKAVMYRESRGNPDAVSPVGAIGLMQFMPSTAKGLGYSTNDMKNPEKAIEASAKYFKGLSQYACNGKSSNAVCSASTIDYQIAAYNGGPGSNKPSTSCTGKTWWQCTSNPGYSETRHYVSTVLANYQSLKEKGWTCN